jgi:hypothetical protein
METQAWLDHALESEYITTEDHFALDAAWQEIGGMLYRMIEKTDSFCPPSAAT